MKKSVKFFVSLIISVCMALSFSINTFALDANVLINQLIGYYATYQERANVDIARTLDELYQVDEIKGEEWEKIMDYWKEVNTDFKVNIGQLPDGLANDNSLCITVLGFALNDDGTMKDELIGRLETALACANKYPQAYVAVTGGGTAKDNQEATEADLMAEWMIAHGLDESRLIIENKSKSTVENAKFTYAILREKYPEIKTMAIVTSHYHVPRGCLLYNTQLMLSAYEAGDQFLDVVSNAGYDAGHEGYESLLLQAYGLMQIAGTVGVTGAETELSVLDHLNVQHKESYKKGEELDFVVEAIYQTPSNTEYAVDVSNDVILSEFDNEKEGTQSITVTYNDGYEEVSKTIDILIEKEIIVPEKPVVEEKEEISTDKKEEVNTDKKENVQTGDDSLVLLYGCIASMSILGYMSLKRNYN